MVSNEKLGTVKEMSDSNWISDFSSKHWFWRLLAILWKTYSIIRAFSMLDCIRSIDNTQHKKMRENGNLKIVLQYVIKKLREALFIISSNSNTSN